MNRSPDPTRAELEAEERLIAAERLPDDHELAADWALGRELRGLDVPPLPPGLRSRVMNATHHRQRPAWWLGLAAAVMLGLAVVLIIEPFDPPGESTTVAEAELHDLQLALASLELGARRAGSAARSELSRSLFNTRIDLDELPYASQIGRWVQPHTSNDHQPPTQESQP